VNVDTTYVHTISPHVSMEHSSFDVSISSQIHFPDLPVKHSITLKPTATELQTTSLDGNSLVGVSRGFYIWTGLLEWVVPMIIGISATKFDFADLIDGIPCSPLRRGLQHLPVADLALLSMRWSIILYLSPISHKYRYQGPIRPQAPFYFQQRSRYSPRVV
jgi:hypothetical protein